MSALGLALLGIVVLLVELYACSEFYRSGRERGWREGYDAGRKAADNWWIGVETEADRERQKIWREEG